MTHRWRNLAAALLLLTAAGAARLPLENNYTASLREQHLLEPPLNLDLRDELGQTFFIAVLGGFRSIVATVMELKTVQPWLDENWGVVDQYYAMCCKLQPREERYWEERAWNLAANARDGFRYDSRYSEETRHLFAQQSVEKGIDVLLDGVQHRPDSHRLYERIAYYTAMPWNDRPDHAKAAGYYGKAASLPGALPFYKRFRIYELAQAPGREREAWAGLMELYLRPEDRTTSVEMWLLKLYQKDPSMLLPFGLQLELQLLIQDGTRLTPRQRQHMQQLGEAIKEQRRLEAGRLRAPQVDSPGLRKAN